MYFVPDSDFPTPFRSWSLFPQFTVPTYGIFFAPLLIPVPPQDVFPTFPAPPSAQLFSSHPDVRTQFFPSRNSLKWQMFPSHLPSVVYFSHHIIDATNWIVPI